MKLISAKEAADLIENDARIATVGMTLSSACEEILTAIEEKFLSSKTPKNLTLIHAAGQSDRERGIAHLAHKGLLKRVVGSHWGLNPKMMKLIVDEDIEAICLPQGQICHLFHAQAAGLPGRLSKVGLGTFIELEGGFMNEKSRKLELLVEKTSFMGEEYLFYKTLPFDFLLIRGTHIDERGNLTTSQEAMKLEVLHAVLAAKACGAKVIAQAKYLAANDSLHPKDVIVPGSFIDYCVLSTKPSLNHRQSSSFDLDLALCGDLRLPQQALAPLKLDIRKLIGRIACSFLKEPCLINLGTGIPNDVVGKIIQEEGLGNDITISVESGIFGGVQEGGIDFGIGRNLSAMISHSDAMLYYNGTGIDATFMGAGEMDASGNVNATKLGGIAPGAGGFIDITQNARRVIFCSTFNAKGLEISCEDGKLRIIKEGSLQKLVSKVQQISYSSEIARKSAQEMLYVTERAVFTLGAKAPKLIQIAPGVDLEKDILSLMAFKPEISETLEVMDSALFKEPAFGLSLKEKK